MPASEKKSKFDFVFPDPKLHGPFLICEGVCSAARDSTLTVRVDPPNVSILNGVEVVNDDGSLPPAQLLRVKSLAEIDVLVMSPKRTHVTHYVGVLHLVNDRPDASQMALST